MSNEDLFIEVLLNTDNLLERDSLTKDFLIQEYFPLTKKILWAYDKVKSEKINNGRLKLTASEFLNNFFENQFNFYTNILQLYSAKNKEQLNIQKSIIISYHFSGYPLLAQYLSSDKIKILVARDSYWLQNYFGSTKLINFKNRSSIQIIREMSKGTSIFAMLDYCYHDTRSIYSNFLSIPSLTPIGLIELAMKFNYKILLADIDNNNLSLTEITTWNNSIQEIIDSINKLITTKIIENPGDWLLWASLDRRWNTSVSVLDKEKGSR